MCSVAFGCELLLLFYVDRLAPGIYWSTKYLPVQLQQVLLLKAWNTPNTTFLKVSSHFRMNERNQTCLTICEKRLLWWKRGRETHFTNTWIPYLLFFTSERMRLKGKREPDFALLFEFSITFCTGKCPFFIIYLQFEENLFSVHNKQIRGKRRGKRERVKESRWFWSHKR